MCLGEVSTACVCAPSEAEECGCSGSSLARILGATGWRVVSTPWVELAVVIEVVFGTGTVSSSSGSRIVNAQWPVPSLKIMSHDVMIDLVP